MIKVLVLLSVVMCHCNVRMSYYVDDKPNNNPPTDEVVDINDMFKEQSWCKHQKEDQYYAEIEDEDTNKLTYDVQCAEVVDVAKYFVPDQYFHITFYRSSTYDQFSECSEKIPKIVFNSINFYLHYDECEFVFGYNSSIKQGNMKFTLYPYDVYPGVNFTGSAVGICVIIIGSIFGLCCIKVCITDICIEECCPKKTFSSYSGRSSRYNCGLCIDKGYRTESIYIAHNLTQYTVVCECVLQMQAEVVRRNYLATFSDNTA